MAPKKVEGKKGGERRGGVKKEEPPAPRPAPPPKTPEVDPGPHVLDLARAGGGVRDALPLFEKTGGRVKISSSVRRCAAGAGAHHPTGGC
ncbi:hypothetical protein PBY51_004658 [Eleginops maclovinus]|uniref:Uncharacterized protein n=1 Tax=Eleginops maclovinus TaxID=56733 RepID=A0AAN8AWG4_ELEMC|nr:hypothetical protein PBY51_004658 [Eleginops maclovinus]